MSSLTSLSIDSNEPLLKQLNDVFYAVNAKVSNNAELVEICRDLHLRTVSVIKFAKLYDYNEQTEANGYWTFVRLVIKCGKFILNERGVNWQKDIIPVSKVLRTGLDLCERFHKDSQQRANGITSDDSHKSGCNLFALDPEDFVDLLDLFGALAPQLDVIYGSYCAYWLCPSMRRTMQGFTTLMAMYSSSTASFSSLWHSSKNLWDSSHRAQKVAIIAQNASVDFVKSFWGLTEYSIVKNGLPSLVVRAQPKIIKDVYIPRQNRWQISSQKADVIDTNLSQIEELKNNESISGSSESERKRKLIDLKIRCRLLQHDCKGRTIDSVVLHIHGGGFVSQSPDSHEVYLREWATKLEGVPILSVDYSLSPEARYPIALQEVLDTYLWLVSKDQTVEQILGFHPTKIVICGDSAGGNLSAALALVLNDMRKKELANSPKIDFQIPTGILCFYAPLMLMTRPSPSRLMTAVDTLLPLGVLLSCLEAYAPSEPILVDESQSTKEATNLINTPQNNLSPMNSLSGVTEAESEHEENQSFDFATLHFLKSDSDCEKVSASEEDEEEEEETIRADDLFNEVGQDFVHITYDDVPPDEDLLFEIPNDLSSKWQRRCYQTLLTIKDKIIGPPQPSNVNSIPWYRQSPTILNAKLKQLNKSTSNPYISPFLMEDFEFDDIPLYLVALTYDACLDDSIDMAKKWKGPVVLDILDELPHGFLNFVLLSEEGRRGSDLCINRIRQALGLY